MTIAVGLVWRTLVITSLAGLCGAVCPLGWLVDGVHCYFFLQDDSYRTVAEYRNGCWELGGELASIETSAEETAVFALLMAEYPTAGTRPQYVYIGLSDLSSEGIFTWLDASVATYTNWKAGDPDDGTSLQASGEDCVLLESADNLWSTGNGLTKWTDAPCCFLGDGLAAALCKVADGASFTPPAADIISQECQGSCPDGWWQLGGSRCFSVFPSISLQASDARRLCRQNGGELATLDSQNAVDMAISIMRVSNTVPASRGTAVFIGLNDLDSEGQYTWFDGATFVSGTPITVTSDDVGSTQNCVTMVSPDDAWSLGSAYVWEDTACCAANGVVSQALCSRSPGLSDYDWTLSDELLHACSGVYCPRGAFYHAYYVTSCFTFVAEPRTFAAAEATCSANVGGHLISTHVDIDQYFLPNVNMDDQQVAAYNIDHPSYRCPISHTVHRG
nr:C-type lectin domain-containing type 1 protein 6 [Arenicola marina]